MTKPFTPIAIIGRGCVLPGAANPAALWDVVQQQRITLRPATEQDWRIEPDAIVQAQPGEIRKDAA